MTKTVLEGVVKEGLMEERSKLGFEMLMEMQEGREKNDTMERERVNLGEYRRGSSS